MNVAHILGYLAPKYGGPPQVALQLGKSLQKHNVAVSWWATATEQEQKELSYLGDQTRLFNSTRPYSWFYSSAFYKELQKSIAEIDILHLHQVWDYPVFAAAQIAKQHNKPIVITPHGIFSQRWRYDTPKKRIYLRFIAYPFLNRASVIHAITPNEISGFKTARIHTPYALIPNGINPEEFSNLPHPDEADKKWPVLRNQTVVLFLGRLSPEKGLDLLLCAWKSITQKYQNVTLMLAGPGHQQYRSRIENLVEAYNIRHSVFLPGMLKGRDKLMALSRADIFVLPSYSEGLSLSLLEALVCGKPCVITTGCNFSEVETIGAGKVVSPQAEEIEEALTEMLSLSPSKRLQMGEIGKQHVLKKYTWEIVGQQMSTLYQNIINGAVL